MKSNVNTADRIIRIIAAALIAVLFFTNVISGTSGIILLVVGAVLLITSFINFCPLYALLGISTNKQVKKSN